MNKKLFFPKILVFCLYSFSSPCQAADLKNKEDIIKFVQLQNKMLTIPEKEQICAKIPVQKFSEALQEDNKEKFLKILSEQYKRRSYGKFPNILSQKLEETFQQFKRAKSRWGVYCEDHEDITTGTQTHELECKKMIRVLQCSFRKKEYVDFHKMVSCYHAIVLLLRENLIDKALDVLLQVPNIEDILVMHLFSYPFFPLLQKMDKLDQNRQDSLIKVLFTLYEKSKFNRYMISSHRICRNGPDLFQNSPFVYETFDHISKDSHNWNKDWRASYCKLVQNICRGRRMKSFFEIQKIQKRKIIDFIEKKCLVQKDKLDSVVGLVKLASILCNPITLSFYIEEDSLFQCMFMRSIYYDRCYHESLMRFLSWVLYFDIPLVFRFTHRSILVFLIEKGLAMKEKRENSLIIIEGLLEKQLMDIDYKPSMKCSDKSFYKSPLDIILSEEKDIDFKNRVLKAYNIGKKDLLVRGFLRQQPCFTMLASSITFMILNFFCK